MGGSGVKYRGKTNDMNKAITAILLTLLPIAVSAGPQDKSEKFALFIVGLDAAAPVSQSLIKKLNETKPFEAVSKKDLSKVNVLISCMLRKNTEPFVCMYSSHYNGPSFQSFLGGGLFYSTSADAVATNFLASIAEDIVERFDNTDVDNLRHALESCLLLTESKCNVPDPLQKEYDAKQLTLGQYLLKKH